MAAVHAILLLYKLGWNGLVTEPHILLSYACVGEMFIETLRAFKISLELYSKLVVSLSSSMMHIFILPTNPLLDWDIRHPFLGYFQINTHKSLNVHH